MTLRGVAIALVIFSGDGVKACRSLVTQLALVTALRRCFCTGDIAKRPCSTAVFLKLVIDNILCSRNALAYYAVRLDTLGIKVHEFVIQKAHLLIGMRWGNINILRFLPFWDKEGRHGCWTLP